MLKTLIALAALAAAPVLLVAQQPAGLDPATLLKPLAETWPTYSGDYTGRRYSALTQVNQGTVKNLGLAWMSCGFVQGSGPTGRAGGAAAAAAGAPRHR
jgi:alcohol dehydrogenase (cytochrome c)